jgi:hypothetical protein
MRRCKSVEYSGESVPGIPVQMQSKLPLHAGALTALVLQGFAHDVPLGKQIVYLFSPIKTRLPAWFRNHESPQLIVHESTS